MSIRTLVRFGSGIALLGINAWAANPSFNDVVTDTNAVMTIGDPGVISASPLTGNPITAGNTTGDRDPTVCYVTNLGKYFIYYARTVADYTTVSVTIGGKVSFDGTNWVDLGLVLDVNPTGGKFDSGSVGSPFAFVENSTIYLYYQGGAAKSDWGAPDNCLIGLATSTDGTNFTRVTAGTSIFPGVNGYAPGVSKQGSTYVLFASRSSPFRFLRGTNSSGPDQPFVQDTSLAVWTAPFPFTTGHEEACPVQVSPTLWYAFFDNLASTVSTKDQKSGVGFYWTTNLLGQTNAFNLGAPVNTAYATNAWNVSAYGSSGCCLMTNGNYLLVSDAFATNGSSLATRRIGGTILRLGKVPRLRPSLIGYTETGATDTGSGVWVRIASRPRWMQSKIDVGLFQGSGGDGITRASFVAAGRRAQSGSAFVSSVNLLAPGIDFDAAGSGIDQARMTAGSGVNGLINFDVHLTTGESGGNIIVNADGYPSTEDLVTPYPVPDAPPGETISTVVPYWNPAANSLMQHNGAGSFWTNAPTVNTVYSAAGSGTDQAGTAQTRNAGVSTGTGAGGALIEQTALSASGTGSSANALSTRTYVRAKETTLTESTPTKIVTISLGTGKSMGIRVLASTRADDATNFQLRTDSFFISAVNKAGTITAAISTIGTGDTAAALSSGTLATTWTAVDDGSGVLSIKNSAVSSLTQTTLACRWRIDVDSTDTPTVTPQ